MRRFPASAMLTALVALSVIGAAAEQPVFRASSDVVRVFTTVTDKDGRLVTTLTQDAFEVRDEGKPQPIVLFDNSPQPIRLIELLDVSGSMTGNLALLRAASDELFAHLRRDDVARVGSFGREVTISPEFTGNIAALRRALPQSIDPSAPTPLWRAIEKAMDAFAEQSDPARSVILVLSDGKDSGPISWTQPVSSQGGVIDRARKEDVMIYAVAMRSRTGRPMPPAYGPRDMQALLAADLPDPGLARVAEETGGGYIEIRLGEDLASAFAAVADELHSQYLLGFAPPKRDGKVHEIEVKVSQRGLKPRARKSYVAPKQ